MSKTTINRTGSIEKSRAEMVRAMKVLPGGVNSPVRAFGGVGGTPRVICKAGGATLTDIDDNVYIDYVGSWGPMILGHTDERVVAAVSKALRRGCSFGAPTESETRRQAGRQSGWPKKVLVTSSHLYPRNIPE